MEHEEIDEYSLYVRKKRAVDDRIIYSIYPIAEKECYEKAHLSFEKGEHTLYEDNSVKMLWRIKENDTGNHKRNSGYVIVKGKAGNLEKSLLELRIEKGNIIRLSRYTNSFDSLKGKTHIPFYDFLKKQINF